LGSNAVEEAGPDRRFKGIALSARLSTKSRTIKSLLEKFSSVKLGPLGKRDFAGLARSIVESRAGRRSPATGSRGLHVGGEGFQDDAPLSLRSLNVA
jgi:hypothetical protein